MKTFEEVFGEIQAAKTDGESSKHNSASYEELANDISECEEFEQTQSSLAFVTLMMMNTAKGCKHCLLKEALIAATALGIMIGIRMERDT